MSFELQIATINLNRCGVSAVDRVADFRCDFPFQIAALPEADIPVQCAAGFIHAWKRRQMQASLSNPDAGVHRVALCSQIPFRPCVLNVESAATRYAAGTFEVQGPNGQCESLLVVAVYLQARNEAAAQQQASEIVSAAVSTGLRYVLIGDFNLEQHQAALGFTIQTGGTHACDSCASPGSLPHTGPGRKRRIDFALSHWRLPASSVHHQDCYFSDHLVVKYHFQPCAPLAMIGPSRRKVTARTSKHIAELFQACQTQDVTQAIEQGNLDEAWVLLSDVAEQCLCEPSANFVPRSAHWTPTTPQVRGQNRNVLCSPSVAGLRKLYGRLCQLKNRPWDRSLAARIQISLAGIRQRVPELPFLSGECLQHSAPVVRQLLLAYEKQERDAILAAWKNKLRQDDHRIRSFIKNRTEQQLLYEQGIQAGPMQEGARHPAFAVQAQANTWSSKWNSESSQDWSALSRLLQGVQRPQPCQISMSVTANQLLQNAKAMSSKVGGADSWEARDLCRLPIGWWDLAAAIWNAAVARGVLPEAWCKAKVVLIWKKQGRTRPISLFSILWRSGAKALAANMRPWCNSWQSHYDTGGLPATGVSAAHMQLHQSLRRGAWVLAQQDLAAFFDSIQWGALEIILMHLRAPPALISILRTFYQQSKRIFVLEGAFCSQWTAQKTGLAQGCPLSPYLAAAVTHCWCELTIAKGISGFGYLDDRTILLQEGFSLEVLRAALQRSADFDRACGLTCAPDKCFLASGRHSDLSRSIALQFDLQVCEAVDVLGLTVDFKGGWQLLKFSLRKAVLRLRLLKWTQTSTFKKQKLVRSLVLPCLHWAAAFAAPSRDDLFAVKQEIFSLFNPWYGQEAARVLIFEHLSWQIEPEFATDIACIREVWRFLSKAPTWTDTCPLDRAFPRWHEAFPRVQSVLEKLQWNLNDSGSRLQRLDGNGVIRSLEVGVDSFSCVHRWLTDHFRGEYMKKTGRVVRSLHRRDPDLARGFDLPAPPPGHAYAFGGHRICHDEATDSYLHHASSVTGGSAWFLNAGQRFFHSAVQSTCLCGASQPSRVHITWCCPCTQDLREGLTLPTDRAQERLFCQPVPILPPAPHGVDPLEFVDRLAEHLSQAWCSGHPLYISTDGGSKDEVGGFAIHFAGQSFGAGTGHEDQTAFRQELNAILFLSRGLKKAASTAAGGHVYIICDCQAAISSIEARETTSAYPLLVQEIQLNLQHASISGVSVSFIWVPSRNKQPEWRPPAGHDGPFLRRLNESVDAHCTEILSRRLQGSLRQRWQAIAHNAIQWEYNVIHAAAKAAERLHQHFQRVGTQPGSNTQDEASV